MAEPWFAELIRNSTGILLGWALGVGTTALTDWRKNRKKLKATKRAISAELGETAFRMLGRVYKGEASRGGLKRDLLAWMLPNIERYAGPDPADGALAGVKGLLARTDAELAQVAAIQRATMPPQFWAPEDAPYTAGALAQAHDFDPDYAIRALEVIAHLRMYNATREDWLHYSRLTFDSGLTPENHARAIANADSAEEALVRRSRVVIEKITALDAKALAAT